MGSEDISIGIESTGADTTADDVNKVTQAIKDLNNVSTSGVTTFATSLDGIKDAATGATEPLTTAKTGLQDLGGAYDEAATKSKG
jgi:archaellum component FlaC